MIRARPWYDRSMVWVARLGLVAAMLSTSALAFADSPSKEQCINAYQGAQVDMKQSALGAAREKLALCLSDGCPRSLQTDCALWLKEVDARRPSVVLSFKAHDGSDATGVLATIDGKPAAGKTDGRAFDVDPGEHVFVFLPQGEPAVSVKAVIREGEKSQRVAGVSSRHVAQPAREPSDPRPTAARAPTERPVPWPVYALGGVSLVGLGAFAGFGAAGASAKSDLEVCRPSCLDTDVSSVRTKFIVADISLVVGVVALAGAAAFYFTRPEVPRAHAARTAPLTATWLGSGVRGEF